MEKFIYLNNLFDFYKSLFTEKQRLYFEDYYCNNLSLSEIAENNSISRNAVFNQLKIIEDKLLELEENLGLFKKKNEILSMLDGKIDREIYEKIEEIL